MRELDRKKLGARKVIVGPGVPADLVSAGDVVVDLARARGASRDEDAPVLDVARGPAPGLLPLPAPSGSARTCPPTKE